RDTVPEPIDEAVARALSKSPADRFLTAGDFARALDVRQTTASNPSAAAPAGRRRMWIAAGAAVVVVVAALGALRVTGRLGSSGHHAVLGRRTQLTSSGNILSPAISPDGK